MGAGAEVASGTMLLVGGLGLAVNLVALVLLRPVRREPQRQGRLPRGHRRHRRVRRRDRRRRRWSVRQSARGGTPWWRSPSRSSWRSAPSCSGARCWRCSDSTRPRGRPDRARHLARGASRSRRRPRPPRRTLTSGMNVATVHPWRCPTRRPTSSRRRPSCCASGSASPTRRSRSSPGRGAARAPTGSEGTARTSRPAGTRAPSWPAGSPSRRGRRTRPLRTRHSSSPRRSTAASGRQRTRGRRASAVRRRTTSYVAPDRPMCW